MSTQLDSYAQAADMAAASTVNLGGTVPAPLGEALDALQRLNEMFYEDTGGAEITHLLSQLRTAPADEVVGIAKQAAARQQRAVGLRAVQQDATQAVQRRVTAAVKAAGEGMLASLAPVFTAAAEGFGVAFLALPSDLSRDALLNGSPDTISTFATARQHAAVLSACASVRDMLAGTFSLKPTAIGDTAERASRYCAVEDSAGLERAGAVAGDGPLGRWGDLLATHGVVGLVWWESSADQAAHVASLEQTDSIYHEDGFSRQARTAGRSRVFS